MSKLLAQLEAEVKKLSLEDQQELRDWLEDLLEDRLEITEEFRSEIELGKAEIAQGQVRVVKP